MLLHIFVRIWFIVVFIRQNVNCAHYSYEDRRDSASHASVRHQNWQRLEMMDRNGLYWLEWQIKENYIYFKVTVNTRGFIGLGFSQKDGRMYSADMVLLWVDDETGKANALVSKINIA